MSTIKKLVLLFLMIGITNYVSAQKQQPTLNHVAVYVTDLKKSTAFYHDVVQLDTVPEPFHDGLHTWFGIGHLTHLHVIQGATTPMQHDKHNHLCFTVV